MDLIAVLGMSTMCHLRDMNLCTVSNIHKGGSAKTMQEKQKIDQNCIRCLLEKYPTLFFAKTCRISKKLAGMRP